MNQIDFYDSICLKLISLGGKSEYSNPYKMTKVWLEKYNIQYDKLILTNTFDSSEKEWIYRVAQDAKLFCTSGSDFHGSKGRDFMGMKVLHEDWIG